MPQVDFEFIEKVAGIPMYEQCDCCLDAWEVYYRHKHGTDGKLCVPCFAAYHSLLPTRMVVTMFKSFRKKEYRKHYVALIRTQEV